MAAGPSEPIRLNSKLNSACALYPGSAVSPMYCPQAKTSAAMARPALRRPRPVIRRQQAARNMAGKKDQMACCVLHMTKKSAAAKKNASWLVRGSSCVLIRTAIPTMRRRLQKAAASI